MSQDRVTQLRIAGLRTIDDISLDLRGITVLIGENGTGKSTVLEALDMLRLAPMRLNYVDDVFSKGHGGLSSIRRGRDEVTLGVMLEGGGPRLDYELTIGRIGTSLGVVRESLDVSENPTEPEPRRELMNEAGSLKILDAKLDLPLPPTIGNQVLSLPLLRSRARVFDRVAQALERIEVHVPFDVRPVWQQRELKITEGPRWPSIIESTNALRRYASNLPNAYQHLRNLGGAGFLTRVIERAKLGLGDDLRDFRLSPVGRGSIELEVVFGSWPDDPLPVEALSEGELSYLAFIALCELNAERTALAFDEPELHLHPALLTRVAWMLEDAASRSPIIVATHSDRCRVAVMSPAESVVLCELDETRSMKMQRPDPERLADWLTEYNGMGSIRANGYEAHVFADRDPGNRAK